MPHPSPKRASIELPIMAQLVDQGDGTFVLKPRSIAGFDNDAWLDPAKAAKMIGVKKAAIYGLLEPSEPFLVSRRPLSRKILVSLKSILAFREATVNPDFWTDAGKTLRNNLLAAVRSAQAALIGD